MQRILQINLNSGKREKNSLVSVLKGILLLLKIIDLYISCLIKMENGMK